jgi:3-isopropylmalate/(R)-2-methylmalate dehydratase small subunit
MRFEPFTSLTSRTVVLAQDDIDTDQIIPARFLTTTTREKLGRSAFYDWRYDSNGNLRNSSPLDGFDRTDYAILVAGSNFGCGSSREHAPWALTDFGFRAVISSRIADIFKSNALKNGLLPIEVDTKTHQRLLNTPGERVSIDLMTQTVRLTEGWQTVFEVEPFARRCLLEGVDPLGHLLYHIDAIEEFEESRV